MKKKVFVIIVILILIILLVPIPMKLLDGTSVRYKAILYEINKYHRVSTDNESGYEDVTTIELLGKEVYNSSNKNEEDDNKNYSFVGTIIEETSSYIMVKPNEDEEEAKFYDKVQINFSEEHTDYLYGVGRKVVINYTGQVLRSNPAQINTDDILVFGYEDFNLEIKESKNIESKKILNNKDLYENNSDYSLYYYGLDEVNITINNKKYSLEEALKSGKITLEGLIIKANKDFPDTISYDDGGSKEYHYENYTIIKLNKLFNSNNDVYIGNKNLKIQDLDI